MDVIRISRHKYKKKRGEHPGVRYRRILSRKWISSSSDWRLPYHYLFLLYHEIYKEEQKLLLVGHHPQRHGIGSLAGKKRKRPPQTDIPLQTQLEFRV